ncbi:MAG: LysR family transcriptional regulator substrate-binding protein, partial [Sedimenticolaceae bacterium]
AVEVGDLELAIVTLPPTQPSALPMQVIWHDPLAFMVGREHPLAGRDTLSLTELLRYPAVLPGTTTYTRGILESAVQEAGVEIHVAMATNYLETLHMLVATGLGWSLLPATVLDGEVHALTVEGMQLSRELGAVTHRKRSLSNAAQKMIDTCLTPA